MDELKERFVKLWNHLGASGAQRQYSWLKKQYDQEYRQYHNLTHIQNVLSEFDMIRYLSTNHLSLELAIFYHDVVYDCQAHDNEHRSVYELLRVGHKSGIRPYFLREASKLIIATQHTYDPRTIDEKIIMDCDIASFGKTLKEFESINSNIRKEYSFVEPEVYSQQRNKILQKFLDKDRIYYTDEMYTKYEKNARKNIERMISINYTQRHGFLATSW